MRVGYWAILIAFSAGSTVVAQNVDLHVTQTLPGTGFTGAPYSAKQTEVITRMTDNGVRYSSTTDVLLYRDAAGRTREEASGKTASGTDFHFVTVLDPVAGVSLSWPVSDNPSRKLVTIRSVQDAQRITEPVTSRFGLPPANPPTAKAEPIPYGCPECTVKTEYFAARLINGVNALGSRTTRTYKLGTKENGHDLVATGTYEIWTSPELRINVQSVVDRPEFGKTTINITDVVRGEQDPALFKAPAGYQIRDSRAATGPTDDIGGNTTRGIGVTATQTVGLNSSVSTAANALDGAWVNVDASTRGLVKVTIDGLRIHPFSACRPNPCDWEVLEGKIFSASADSAGATTMTAQKYTTFSETTLALMLEADGRLRVDDFTQFVDDSGRANYHTVTYFRREPAAGQTAASPLVAGAPATRTVARSSTTHPWFAMWNADNLIPPAGYAVEGAPFEALIEETRTPIGSETMRRLVRVLRDGAGRQRYEELINADCKGCQPAVTGARVIDVVSQRSIRIDPVTRIAISCPAPVTSQPVRVPASTSEAQKDSGSGWLRRLTGKDESQDKAGEPQVAGLQVTLADATHEDSTEQTASAPTLHVVNELWTSALYRMPVKRVIEDPNYGHIDIEVVQFKPGEPIARLFQVPAGYVVKTEADGACGPTRTNVDKQR